tara:strand:+ start:4796 stop:5803 length:1008 start_codon:yes stop_codon:yes gene_type:complete
MKVYKYRSCNRDTFFRDLIALRRNYFWSAGIKTLNDPCEGFVTTNGYNSDLNIIGRIFNTSATSDVTDALNQVVKRTKEVGIFSLSKSYNEELLWAHYGNSHNGFCIEYEIEKLLNSNKVKNPHSFSVDYSKKVPDINFSDQKDQIGLIKKAIGTKSTKWIQEKEYRIITDNPGIYNYSYDAVTGIYFGVRMENNYKQLIMKYLQGRGINYWDMYLEPNTYLFERKPVEDSYLSEITYLKEITDRISNKKIRFSIVNKSYKTFFKIGEIEIEVKDKYSISQVKQICRLIRKDLFAESVKIFLRFYLEGKTDAFVPWVNIIYEDGSYDIEVDGRRI